MPPCITTELSLVQTNVMWS